MSPAQKTSFRPLPRLRLVLTAGGLALLALLLPTGAQGQLSLVSPAVEERAAAPGSTYGGSIVVANLGTEALELVVYQTDYRFLADGQGFYDPPGSTGRSNAPWITFAPARLVVQPGRQEAVAYTVTVPRGSPPPTGTHWSILMVEGVPPHALESSRATGSRLPEMGLSTRVRYAVQIATHMDRPGTTDASFGDPVITRSAAGVSSLAFTLVNNGDRGYRPAIRLELFDEATGVPAATYQQQRGLLYPGTALRQEFSLGEVSPGVYKAMVVVDTGRDEVFGAQYTLRF